MLLHPLGLPPLKLQICSRSRLLFCHVSLLLGFLHFQEGLRFLFLLLFCSDLPRPSTRGRVAGNSRQIGSLIQMVRSSLIIGPGFIQFTKFSLLSQLLLALHFALNSIHEAFELHYISFWFT